MRTLENNAVEVRLGTLGRAVYLCADAPAGAVLARGWGVVIPHRTQHSVQVDFDTHLDVEPPLRFVNHSCEPNCGLLIDRARRCIQLHALREIGRGEELCIDYATFEYEIGFMPQRCLCGSAECRGRVTGFNDLPTASQQKLLDQYGPYVAQHLRRASPLRTLELETAVS